MSITPVSQPHSPAALVSSSQNSRQKRSPASSSMSSSETPISAKPLRMTRYSGKCSASACLQKPSPSASPCRFHTSDASTPISAAKNKAEPITPSCSKRIPTAPSQKLPNASANSASNSMNLTPKQTVSDS